MTTLETRRQVFGGASAAVLLLAMSACGGGSTTPNTGGGGGQVSLTAQNISYQPSTLSVTGGQQVTISFMNKDSVEHSITFDDNSKSVDADGGQTQTLTFMAPSSGTITFHCKYHPTKMKGTITVGGSGGSGAGGSGSSSSSSGY